MLTRQLHSDQLADPGFPRRKVPTYYLANFSRKLHENEKKCTGGGGEERNGDG